MSKLNYHRYSKMNLEAKKNGSFGEAQIDTAHSIFSLDVVNVEGDKESVVYMQGDEADDAIRAINKIYITEENITVEEAIGKWMNLYL